MYGFMRGFQRCVWWPKCAPASINCCMVTTGAAIVFLLPVEPLGISDRVLPGTGMCDSHVEFRALPYRSERTQDLTEPGIQTTTRTYFVIRPRRFLARCRKRLEKCRLCPKLWIHSIPRLPLWRRSPPPPHNTKTLSLIGLITEHT